MKKFGQRFGTRAFLPTSMAVWIFPFFTCNVRVSADIMFLRRLRLKKNFSKKRKNFERFIFGFFYFYFSLRIHTLPVLYPFGAAAEPYIIDTTSTTLPWHLT